MKKEHKKSAYFSIVRIVMEFSAPMKNVKKKRDNFWIDLFNKQQQFHK